MVSCLSGFVRRVLVTRSAVRADNGCGVDELAKVRDLAGIDPPHMRPVRCGLAPTVDHVVSKQPSNANSRFSCLCRPATDRRAAELAALDRRGVACRCRRTNRRCREAIGRRAAPRPAAHPIARPGSTAGELPAARGHLEVGRRHRRMAQPRDLELRQVREGRLDRILDPHRRDRTRSAAGQRNHRHRQERRGFERTRNHETAKPRNTEHVRVVVERHL